jgi:hypothetical protein
MQKFTAEVELTSTLSSRMSEKKFLRPQTMLFTVKKSEENWGKTSYVNILGWLMAQDWLQFFCLILMKKAYIKLLTLLYPCGFDYKSKQKNTTKNILAPNLLRSYLFIFSQFFLPTYIPAHPSI